MWISVSGAYADGAGVEIARDSAWLSSIILVPAGSSTVALSGMIATRKLIVGFTGEVACTALERSSITNERVLDTAGRSLANALAYFVAISPGTETEGQSDSISFKGWGGFARNSLFRRAVVSGSANPAHKKRNKPITPAPAESAAEGGFANRATDLGPAPCDEPKKRVYETDRFVCSRSGGTLRVLEDVTEADVIRTNLDHLQQRAPPGFPPLRAPPARTLLAKPAFSMPLVI